MQFDGELLETFVVRLSDSMRPDWMALKSQPTVQVIKVVGMYQFDMDKSILQLAIAIKSLRNLQAIEFLYCSLHELGPLCVATWELPLTLRFNCCTIEVQAAKTLQFMLHCDTLGELSFVNCKCDDSAARTIEAGLRENLSLRKFVLDMQTNETPIKGVGELLDNNEDLVSLELKVTDKSFWNIFRTSNENETLESLKFYSTRINLHSIEAILMKCFMMESLQDLSFNLCKFTESAMDLLVTAVSRSKILDTLCLCSVSIEGVDSTFELNCRNLQVRKLGLLGGKFNLAFSTMLDDIASNPCIQCLDLSRGALNISEEGFEKLCEAFLRPNLGPSELIIDEIHNSAANVISEALEHNSSIQLLTIGGLEGSCLVAFAESVATMRGLRKLSFTGVLDDDEYLENFFQTLEASMERNNTLQTLSISDIHPNHAIAKRYLPKIRYFLAINRIGRHSLMTAPTVPAGVWAHVLAKTANEFVGINFVFRSKPDIIVATPSRKRKERR
jgi:hypothetical protein